MTEEADGVLEESRHGEVATNDVLYAEMTAIVIKLYRVPVVGI
jgi:hypothetical protein